MASGATSKYTIPDNVMVTCVYIHNVPCFLVHPFLSYPYSHTLSTKLPKTTILRIGTVSVVLPDA